MSHNYSSGTKCFSVIEVFAKASKSDNGFSGVLHAITGVLAVELFFIALATTGWGVNFYEFSDPAVIVAFSLALIGATLYPDLDNSKSTSHSALGPVGEVLSFVFRSTSRLIQTVVRTPKDDADPNPHRGFYHTGLSAILIGFGVTLLTKISTVVNVPLVGEISVGQILATLFLAVMIHLFLAALAKKFVKKLKSIFVIGDLIAFLVSLAIAVVLSMNIQDTENYLWLGLAITLGGITHIIGDGFTKYGVPIFFPLTVFFKGKFWWYTRFAKLESGGEIEKIIMLLCAGGIFILGLSLFNLYF